MKISIVIVSLIGGCSVLPQSKFGEARQSLSEIRAYALEHVPDLTREEREIIQSREPQMAQANFVVYYFSWHTSDGKTFATVEASPPPCKPHSARRVRR